MIKDVTHFPHPRDLSEIMQQNNTQLALCRYDEEKDTIIQCHQFVRCRDFIHDAFVAVESNREMGIYGFHFGKDNPRPDYTATSLLLKFPDAGTLKVFQDNFSILTNIEEVLGLAPTAVEMVDYGQKDSVIWLMSDALWQDNAVAFSLYGFILKCLGYPIKDKTKWMEEIKKTHTNESQYMDIPWVSYLLNGGLLDISTKYKNYSGWADQPTAPAYRIHDLSGFVSVGEKVQIGAAFSNPHALSGFQMEKAAA